jgi:hemerythrin-like metal-binding protein
MLVWNDTYRIGHDETDAQHQELFRRVDDFLIAMRDGRATQQLRGTLGYLATYAEGHFADEELLMERIGYPGLAEHRRLHNDFRDAFGAFVQRFHDERANVALCFDLMRALADWLRDHVAGADREIGRYLLSQVVEVA